MGIEIGEPPPARKPGRRFAPETIERIEWMDAHPGQWIIWAHGPGTLPTHLRYDHRYESCTRTIDRATTLYARRRPEDPGVSR